MRLNEGTVDCNQDRGQSFKQQELLRYASGFDAKSAMGELAMTKDHVKAFVIGISRKLGVTVAAETHGSDVLELVLPDEG